MSLASSLVGGCCWSNCGKVWEGSLVYDNEANA